MALWPSSQYATNQIRTSCIPVNTTSFLIELETMPDHVQLLVEVDPQFGVHRLIKHIKGTSSRYLRKEFPELRSRLPTLWTVPGLT